MNETHDPGLRSWVESANREGRDFPIQNLPFGVFATREPGESQRVGVAIGDFVFDIAAAADARFLDGAERAVQACRKPSLNPLMALGRAPATALRERLSQLLREDAPERKSQSAELERCLHSTDDVDLRMPVEIGDYTDFYASVYHATNVGSMFRPDNPLLPNYKFVPVGYHGRASSVVLSGTDVRRPNGQTREDEDAPPVYGASRLLDYELEVGFFVGAGNALGKTISIDRAESHIFGVCLVNDWSARDIQKWEYVPLGPFLAKSFATTISPWVVTLDALEPFRAPAFARPEGDPPPLPYLHADENEAAGAMDITLEVFLESRQMRERGLEPMRVSRGNFRDMYWTIAQMLTHHSSNGCNLRTGDLMASGTVSGPAKDSRGCLLERTWRGTEPLSLPTGEERKFLLDGDQVIIRGGCERDGAVRIGFGECTAIVQSAQQG